MNNMKVSIIVPCRNEEKYIRRCLDSIINQDYPRNEIEVLIVDGMSEDKTREIVKEYAVKYPYIKLFDNSKLFAPSAMNIGIKNSQGEIIVRTDAHAVYPLNYISKCLDYLDIFKADAAGGGVETVVGEDKIVARAIMLSLSHPFGTGGSYFRLGSKEPIWVDTVFGGCYRRKVFEKIGLFNENLKRSQDMEFSLRLKRVGGKILLVPDIPAKYYAKSNFREFFVHNIEDGIWAIYPFKFTKMPFRLRHYVPLIFVLILLITGLLGVLSPDFLKLFFIVIGFYLLASFYFSIKVSIREKNIKYLFLMPIAFGIRHFGYGLGSILGVIKLLWK